MFAFIFTFILTIIFSIIIYNILFEFAKDAIALNSELFVYALGIGPALTTLILYYAFLLFPNRSNKEYFFLVIFCYLILSILAFFLSKKDTYKIRNVKLWFNVKYNFFMVFLILFISIFFVADLTKILHRPITGHDTLIYGIMGKMLYAEKSLEPIWVDDFSEQGFIYEVVRKPPSYSLLLTWEKIVASFLGKDNDLYYKSTTVYYSILIIILIYILLSKKSHSLAIIGVLALVSAPAFFLTFFRHHLDTFRIFFQSGALIYLWYSIKKNDPFSIFMLGLFSGFAAFTHTIGLVVACLNVVVFAVFIDEKFIRKIFKTIIVVANIFLFGASYQIFNYIWGRNWIF
jgi:hypothetical protein